MAREANITQEQVNAAADALRAAGIKPTVRAVRDKLGTGSNATVMRLLENWKAGQVKVADVPVTLPGPLQRALVDYLTQAVAEQKQELGAELAEQKQVNADLGVENERQTDEIEAQQTDLEAVRAENASLLGRLVQLEADLRLARAEAEQERVAAGDVRTELAKAQLRLEALPRLEADLMAVRADLDQERVGRTSAEQAAAVAGARLDAESKARERIEADLVAASTREAAAVDQVKDLTHRLAEERMAHVKQKAINEQLQASHRSRLGAVRKSLTKPPGAEK